MSEIKYRIADKNDIDGMAAIRAAEWGKKEYWVYRISGYMHGTIDPGDALKPRVLFVALKENIIVGFIAGHLSRRFSCDGELEWINVLTECRGMGISKKLIQLLAAWFIEQKALKICIDPDDPAFYKHLGAENLNEHWLFWRDIGTVLKK